MTHSPIEREEGKEMKANEQVLAEFDKKFADMLNHIETCTGFSERENIKSFLLTVLLAKDKEIEEAEMRGRIEVLTEILLHYEKNRLEGKGFAFYFVLNNILESARQENLSPNPPAIKGEIIN